MNDLETMLRASLQERAEDVEPTPELWRSVQHKVSRRRAVPLLVWTAAGAAAVVTAAVVGPGLLDGATDRFTIEPGENVTSTATEGTDPGPSVVAPLSHYVAVVDGRLVLRGLDGSESVLWEGEAQVQTVAVRPGATPDELTVAFVTSAEGMLDLRILGPGDTAASWFLGPEVGDAAVVPAPVWRPDGSAVAVVLSDGNAAELVVAEVNEVVAEGLVDLRRAPLSGVEDPGQLRVQDWTTVGGEEFLWFTSLGQLHRAPIGPVGEDWDVGSLERADGDDYVVDIATTADGTQFRLYAGVGGGSGGAEDAGLALEFGNDRITFADLATASPADVWMTGVDGGAFVGLGSEARLVLRNDDDVDPDLEALSGVSYAAWVPGGRATGVPTMTPTTPAVGPSEEAPSASGPLDESGVTPYVAVDEQGRVAVHTGLGQEREVVIDERLWDPQAAVRVTDVTVRPGSSPDEVSGVAFLATEGGPELAWFRAAAGDTAIRRMEGPIGLGNGDTEQRDAPAWSPDGRHIAWVEPADDGTWTLRTVGMAEDGPTGADAGFGLDVDAERLRIARWTWQEQADGVTATGELVLVHPAGEYVVPVERQGDGALAVGNARRMSMEGVPGDEFFDLGARGDVGILLVREGDRIVLWQETRAELPFTDLGDLDLDLDVLEHVSVVTDRATGRAFVVDRAGEVAPLEADAATTHGFDPVR